MFTGGFEKLWNIPGEPEGHTHLRGICVHRSNWVGSNVTFLVDIDALHGQKVKD